MQVLVVDDEPAIRQVLAATIKRAGYDVEHVGSGEAALERLAKGDVDITLSDIKMPGISGIELVSQARAKNIDTVFLMMTAYASVNTAIDAMKAGAYDYMIKPLRNDDVVHRLEQIANIIDLKQENQVLRKLVAGTSEPSATFVSSAMQQLERLASKVAPTDSTVLVTGESGTGKGVMARKIHHSSRRAAEPFIPVNCGAIPENLIESEFFGHVKGAFTGADREKKGLFQEANGGTIFLDEVGELPVHLQVKLLTAIESKEIRPVGSEKGKKVDVRIIAATNRDLDEMVKAGEFREDLYFRLNVFNMLIPPLRERPEDIPVLTDYFLGRQAQKQNLTSVLELDPEVSAILESYGWPGNVRELENVLERASILADGGVITLADLPAQVTRSDPGQGTSEIKGETLREQVRAFEISVILRAIEDTAGDRKKAARKLGVGLSTLYRKLEEYEVEE